MPNTNTVTFSFFQPSPGLFKLYTPYGVFEGTSEQEVYDGFLEFARSQPEALVNELMPETALNVQALNEVTA